MGLRPLPDLPALTGTGRFDPAFAQTNLEVAAALIRFITCTSATRLFYLSLFSIAFGTLARIYFFNRAGDYVAGSVLFRSTSLPLSTTTLKKWTVLWSESINSTVAVHSGSTW
jgi:hypothetical protein